MQIKQIPYESEFYWKGQKYTQFIRPKNPKGRFTVICYLTNDPCGERIDMPAGRKVKPVIRIK